MSEVLQKYREKTEYLQKLTEAYQVLVMSVLSQSKSIIKGDKELEAAIDKVANRVKGAKNIFQVQQIQKDYSALAKKITAASQVRSGGGGGFFANLGSLFGGGKGGKTAPLSQQAKEKRESVPLIDQAKEVIVPYVSLLDGFSKGTLVLADDREPFYNSLRAKRSEKFADLKLQDADSLSRSLYNYFISKSNESDVIEREREELKIIISSLTTYIQSLSLTSKSFGTQLDEYSKKITAATSVDEIKQIQRSILAATLEIQKSNNSIRDQLSESNRKVVEAGEKIAHLEKALQMAREEKSVDSLTQVYNRGYFDERLNEAVAQFHRDKEPCCLIMLDIDHFKQFNDSYGHQAGDQVLRTIAELIKESIRASDTAARYGGEEFALIIYRAKLKNAAKMAENIRKNVARHEFGVLDKTIHITASMGLTEFKPDDTPDMIIQRADKNLYEAKSQGRNKIIFQNPQKT